MAEVLSVETREFLKGVLDQGQKLVLATGVFDILHSEHEKFLRKAKAMGDALMVGIESDLRVKRLKGEDRPQNNQFLRKQQIENLKIADHVFILPDNFDNYHEHLRLIEAIRPAVLAVSSSTPNIEVKKQIMGLVDGRVEVVLQHNPEISTTQIINKQQSEGRSVQLPSRQ